jgi:RND family efflux transporter MFP subunit
MTVLDKFELILSSKPNRSSNNGWLTALLMLTAIAFVGCKGKETEAGAAAASMTELPSVAVQTEAVTEVEVPKVLRLTGTLKGNQETDLAANANGKILSTTVERGQAINKGDILAKVDTRALVLSAAEARAQAKSVEAQQAQAKLECDRYEALKAKGAVTDLEYQQKLTQCQTLPLSAEAANVRARLAAQNVGDGVIRAPFAGVVTERYVEVGQFLRQDSRVATIVALDPIRLQLAVPEAEVGHVTQDALVSFKVSAYPERTFQGKIRFISGALRPSTRDLIVEALVDNADKALRPGMFADAALTVGSRKLPSILNTALLSRDDTERAFFVVDGRIEERVLALGPTAGARTSIEHGGRLDERFVVGDLSQLVNGQPVK